MLSRSLSDCQSLTLNVMIQVSQFVRKSQLCHYRDVLLRKKQLFFRALPELHPPPHPPNSGNLYNFFQTLKFML